MLVELAVHDLGVIRQVSLLLGPGMTALTGETGAGKTLVVDAIELLMGGRADGTMVAPGAVEAVVEGRFVLGGATAGEPDDEEIVLRRVVPREGRSRAYLNGRLATAAALTEVGRGLVDLHGQHDHQSLLAASVQREALDRFGAIDLEPRRRARKALAELDSQLAELGGDEREHARELDLLRFQVAELEAAALEDPLEDEELERVEDALSDAVAHQEAAQRAVAGLDAETGALDRVGAAVAALDGRRPFEAEVERLRALAAELADVATSVRRQGEAIEDDPERLDEVLTRRQLLAELRRKYGASLAEVVEFRDEAVARLDALERRDEAAARLDQERDAARRELRRAETALGAARRAVAPTLAQQVESHLVELAMPKARLEVELADATVDEAGDDVRFLLAANPPGPPLPLARVASGGELARSMLALRLVLSDAPPTLVFDEVDAGVGGTAATAVGRSLASLGDQHQVLVVTHLAQVAAAADAQVEVRKGEVDGVTATELVPLDDAAPWWRWPGCCRGRPTARARGATLASCSTRSQVVADRPDGSRRAGEAQGRRCHACSRPGGTTSAARRRRSSPRRSLAAPGRSHPMRSAASR